MKVISPKSNFSRADSVPVTTPSSPTSLSPRPPLSRSGSSRNGAAFQRSGSTKKHKYRSLSRGVSTSVLDANGNGIGLGSIDKSLKSPIVNGHSRQLSRTSEKWANNQELALEYLKRQRVSFFIILFIIRNWFVRDRRAEKMIMMTDVLLVGFQ